MAIRLDRKLMVRLVKGLNWDTESRAAGSKRRGFPVFHPKSRNRFVSYIANARKLAEHDGTGLIGSLPRTPIRSHAVTDRPRQESSIFQRPAGMGETANIVMGENGTIARLAPSVPIADLWLSRTSACWKRRNSAL